MGISVCGASLSCLCGGPLPAWPLMLLPSPEPSSSALGLHSHEPGPQAATHGLVPRTCGDPLRPPALRASPLPQPPHSCPLSALGNQLSAVSEGLHLALLPHCLLGATEQKASPGLGAAFQRTPLQSGTGGDQWTDRLRQPSQGRLQVGKGPPSSGPFVQPTSVLSRLPEWAGLGDGTAPSVTVARLGVD